MADQAAIPPIPAHIEAKRQAWLSLFTRSTRTHYIMGVAGVAMASLAAALGGESGRFFSAVAAACTAILGFAHPERTYLKFVRAWRVLDLAILKYELGKATMDDLIAAAEKGESLITEFEDKPEPTGEQAPSAASGPRGPIHDRNKQ